MRYKPPTLGGFLLSAKKLVGLKGFETAFEVKRPFLKSLLSFGGSLKHRDICLREIQTQAEILAGMPRLFLFLVQELLLLQQLQSSLLNIPEII